MRRRGLTRRGLVFLVAGAVLLVVGLLGGGDGWQQVGVLLLVIPLLGLAAVHGTRLSLAATRHLDPERVPVDHETAVTLTLESRSRIPAGMLRLEDTMPQALGGHPRFVVDRGSARWQRAVQYRVRPRRRGLVTIGPLVLHAEDPFGCVVVSRTVTAPSTLTVTPAVTVLPAIRIPGEWSGSGESRPRAVAAAGEEDVTVRPYARGDDRRRVHWRASARYDQLMVRREEQPWQSRATVLLDTRTHGHHHPERARGGDDSSFEWAVSAAASVGVHLLTRGYAVRLVTDHGSAVSAAWHDRSAGPGAGDGALLGALAVVEPTTAASIGGVRRLLRGGGASSGVLIAVVGRLDLGEAEALARLRHDTPAALAILVDADAWATRGRGAGAGAAAPSAGAEQAAATLRQAGWSVAVAGPGADVDAMWRQLEARPGGRWTAA
jgi:uncharacterized protein (DUF58 family)